MLRSGLTSVTFRAITIVFKFAIIAFIAKTLSVEEVGFFGLISAATMLGLYLAGFDFYSFSTRELVVHEGLSAAVILRDQFAMYCATLPMVLVAVLIANSLGVLPGKYLVWLVILLPLEHLSQELYRVLVAFSLPVQANFSNFLRSGAWVPVAIALQLLVFRLNDLTVIFCCWIGGAILSILYAAFALPKMPWELAVKVPVNFRWIYKGALVSIPFFISTMALKGIESFDRFAINQFCAAASVGVYSVYFSMANVIQTFVVTGVLAIRYPNLLRFYKSDEKDNYAREYRRMCVAVASSTAVVSALVVVVAPVCLRFLSREEYLAGQNALFILIFSVCVQTIAQLPHYDLYAKNCDSAIAISTVVACCFSVGLNLVLIPILGITGAALSSLIASVVMLMLKFLFSKRTSIEGFKKWSSLVP